MSLKGKDKERALLKGRAAEEIRLALAGDDPLDKATSNNLSDSERLQGLEEILQGFLEERK